MERFQVMAVVIAPLPLGPQYELVLPLLMAPFYGKWDPFIVEWITRAMVL